MNFREYVIGKSLNLTGHDKIDISSLVSFLQDNTDITELNIESCNIGDEGAKALANLSNLTSLSFHNCEISDEAAEELAKLTNLTSLSFHSCKISDEVIEELVTKLPNCSLSQQVSPFLKKSNTDEKRYYRKHYTNVTSIIGLFSGLGTVYLAGAAALTPVAAAIAVFLAAAVVGALVGYGIGKFCEKVSEERQKNPDIGTWDAAKSALSDAFTTRHSKPKLQA